jgi:hypothetical protein
MFHTYTLKPNKHKYRYYVCSNAQKRGYDECPTKSLNAQAIENAVMGQLKLLCANRSLIKDHSCATEMEAIISPVWDDLFPEEKRKILKKVIERVDYAHDTKKLSLILKGIDKCFEFDADLKACQPKNRWHKEIEIQKEPTIVKNLVLARQISRLFDEGRIRDFKQAAVWLNMSPARVSQLMTLNFLSTEIQESILTLPAERINHLSDNTLREIAAEIDWQKQSTLWQTTLK